MANPPRSRKRIHAIPRAPDGSAFEKWEEFIKFWGHGDPIDVDWKGFETWKNLSKQEKMTYEFLAAKVNLAYEKALLHKVEEMKEDDEADSATVGKFDQMYDAYEDQSSDYSSHYDRFDSFHTFDSFSSF